jgi:hypothetical protein
MKLELFVRVKHNNYLHNNKIVSEVSATLLKRKSNGSLMDLITDDVYDIPTLNLHSYEDGVYMLSTTNHSYDIESGIIDDFDLILIEESKINKESDGDFFTDLEGSL